MGASGPPSCILILLGSGSNSLDFCSFYCCPPCRFCPTFFQEDQEYCASDFSSSFLSQGFTDILEKMAGGPACPHDIANLSVGTLAPLGLCLTLKVIRATFSSPLGRPALSHFMVILRRYWTSVNQSKLINIHILLVTFSPSHMVPMPFTSVLWDHCLAFSFLSYFLFLR